MLQKGIIIKNEDKYTVRVRVPKYDKMESSANGTSDEDLATGIVCTLPGMNLTYAPGDIVLVDFENDELTKPVVLGLLYREHESDAVLEIDGVDSSIESINNTLNELNSKNYYTHIKYSNDNGMTFTSLYDPSQVEETDDFSISPISPIPISPKTKVIYWNIIDENNVDITEKIAITTTLAYNNTRRALNKTITYSSMESGPIFEVPFDFQLATSSTISFSLELNLEIANQYYICLTTDLDSIGSIYGDYIGIQISNEAVPSTNTKDYSWTSTIDRSNAETQRLEEKLLPRIQANELDLRGYTEEDGETKATGLGLLEAINIQLDYLTLGTNRDKVYFGNTSQFISSSESSIHINKLIENEFQLKRIDKSGTPHLVLTYRGN